MSFESNNCLSFNADAKFYFEGPKREFVLLFNSLEPMYFKVSIQVHGEAPKEETDAMVTMGTFNQFKLKKKTIERMPEYDDGCIDAKDAPKTLFEDSKYTQKSCQLSCRLKTMKRECNLVPTKYHHIFMNKSMKSTKNSNPTCSESMDCSFENANRTAYWYFDYIPSYNISDDCPSCREVCSAVEYSFSLYR